MKTKVNSKELMVIGFAVLSICVIVAVAVLEQVK
jgi:hypothetical protein